ncbi:MAG TPA: putative porin, partial [Bacteroidia bacterium]|nr:putative porin [Bacteroidia bacterium]
MKTTCSFKFIIHHSSFIIFFPPFLSFSQDTTSVAPKLPPAHIGFVSEYNIERFGTDSVEAIDSSLSHFYLTDKFLYNITKEKNIFAEEENVFQPDNSIVNFSNDITAPYKFSNRTIKYYKLNRRFTEVTYVQGSKSEQLLNIIYSQHLTKNLNAGLDFRRAGAEGFFRRQQFYQSSFDVYTHYETPSKRYSLFAYYLRNHLEQEENGGIKDFNPNENTVAQPTYLSSAENKQTDKEILLRQTFKLNRTIADS